MANGAPLPESLHKRLFLVFFGMFQIVLAAGLIVGWAGIAGNMLVAPRAEGGAGLSLDQTTQLYGWAASVNYISPLFLGLILDHFGPRACSAFSNFCVALGCVVFASSQNLKEFAIGICLIGFGGPGVQTSLIHLGNLFPSRRFFVMGCVAETITLSFAVLPLMDLVWESSPQLGFRANFGALAIMVCVSAICSLFIWPDEPYQVIEKSEEEKAFITETDEKASSSDPYDHLKHLKFQGQVCSGAYVRLGVFFGVTSFWANFYIATVTTELGDQQRFDEDKQHELARLLSFIDAGAIVCAPLTGYLLDSVGFTETAVCTITLGMAQMVLLLTAGTSEFMLVTSFVAYAVFRAFLFPYFFGSLSRKCGFAYFGMLSGLSFCLSGLSQFAIAPLALVVGGTCHQYDYGEETSCTEGKWDEIHLVQLGCLTALLLIPLLDYLSEKKHKKEVYLSNELDDPLEVSHYGALSLSMRASSTSFSWAA